MSFHSTSEKCEEWHQHHPDMRNRMLRPGEFSFCLIIVYTVVMLHNNEFKKNV